MNLIKYGNFKKKIFNKKEKRPLKEISRKVMCQKWEKHLIKLLKMTKIVGSLVYTKPSSFIFNDKSQ